MKTSAHARVGYISQLDVAFRIIRSSDLSTTMTTSTYPGARARGSHSMGLLLKGTASVTNSRMLRLGLLVRDSQQGTSTSFLEMRRSCFTISNSWLLIKEHGEFPQRHRCTTH